MERKDSTVSVSSQSFFSKVWHRNTPAVSFSENNDATLSYYNQVDWSIVDVNLPDRCGNTPLHLILKVFFLHFSL